MFGHEQAGAIEVVRITERRRQRRRYSLLFSSCSIKIIPCLFCFLFRIQCSTSFDVPDFGFTIIIRLQYPLRHACRTHECTNQSFDSIYNRFQSTLTLTIPLSNDLDVRLVLCTIGNLNSN